MTTRAAEMYWSRNDGETVSTLATLSKPSASSSFGSSAAASTRTPSRSSIALAYSARFSRCSAHASRIRDAQPRPRSSERSSERHERVDVRLRPAARCRAAASARRAACAPPSPRPRRARRRWRGPPCRARGRRLSRAGCGSRRSRCRPARVTARPETAAFGGAAVAAGAAVALRHRRARDAIAATHAAATPAPRRSALPAPTTFDASTHDSAEFAHVQPHAPVRGVDEQLRIAPLRVELLRDARRPACRRRSCPAASSSRTGRARRRASRAAPRGRRASARRPSPGTICVSSLARSSSVLVAVTRPPSQPPVV